MLPSARRAWHWSRPIVRHFVLGDAKEKYEIQPQRKIKPTQNIKRDKIAIIHDIFYLWRVARLGLLLPATFTDEGLISFSWKSLVTRLTLAAWIFMVPYGVFVFYAVSVRELEKYRVKPHDLQEFAQLLTIGVTTLFDIFLPIPVFASMKSFTKFTASWGRMEVKYAALTGSPPHLGIKPFIYTLFTVSQIYSIPLLYAFHDQIGLAFWMMVPLTHAVLSMLSVVMIWVSGYIAVAVLANGLSRRIISDIEQQGAAGLRLHRLLWLHVVKLLRMYHACWGGVQVPFIFFMFIICTVYFFNAFRTLLVEWDEIVQCLYATTTFSCEEFSLLQEMTQNAIVYIACGGGLAFICFSAQAATDQINSTRQKVLRLPLKGKNRVYHYELFTFLEDLRNKDVSLKLENFIEIGRPRLVTMAIMAITYCVVLSQFAFLGP